MKIMKKLAIALCGLAMTVSASAQTQTWKFITAGDGSTYAIKADGTLWAWGWNESGQLGIGGGPEKTAVPQQVGTETNWKSAASGQAFAFFIKEDGTLWATGDNSKGIQGVGDGVGHKSPTQIGTDNNWVSVTATRFFGRSAIGLKADGTLWAWGEGEMGALGLGNYANQSTPKQIGTDTDWKQASVGASHTLALKNDGSLWGWGFNDCDQLTSLPQNVKVPTQIGTETDWAEVFAVDRCSYGIKKDGSLWAWGANDGDMLGIADTSIHYVQTPVKINIPGKVITMSGCENVRVVGVGEDGVITKVYAWGSNADGGLGNGEGVSADLSNIPFESTPVEVDLGGAIVKTIASGQRYTTILTEDGKIIGWGNNRAGQLGDHSSEDQMTFATSPITLGEKRQESGDGIYTFDAQHIPSGLAAAKKLILTGVWNTNDFTNLSASIGNNTGFPPAGNNSIEVIDMSQAEIEANTSLYVSIGASSYGAFRGLKALHTVVMPTEDQASNFSSLRSAFQNCSSLANISLKGCNNVTSIVDAFYECAITSIDLSDCESITTGTESAFDKCANLESIVLPAYISIGKFMFGDCQSLKSIDWTSYQGTTAPAMGSDAFQYINNLKAITVTVPAAAYNAFVADANWNKLTIAKPEEGVFKFGANNIPASLATAKKIVLTGEWNTSAFTALTNAIGNNMGFPKAGNDVLEVVDMSQATLVAMTDLYVPAGLSNTGAFYGCRALNTVILPEVGEAAKFGNFNSTFLNCSALKEIDLTGCVSLTDTEYAFSGCTSLTKATFASAMKLSKNMFDDCTSMQTIDWSSYYGEEAPAYVAIFDEFDVKFGDITIIVPDAAFDSFKANTKWAKFNLVKASEAGIEGVEIDSNNAPAVYYNLQGVKVANPENGVFIKVQGGKVSKVLVK